MSLIAIKIESVLPPVILTDSRRMESVAGELARCEYTLSNCAKRLGVFPRLGVNLWPALRRKWVPEKDDPVDTLLELFIDGKDVAVDRLTQHISAPFVDSILETRLAERDGSILRSKLCLFPCYGKYIVTDQARKNTDVNQVMWLWGESFILGGLVKRGPRKQAVDLGTGSGVHAISASDHCESVVCGDNNPRALEFARFNAVLNGNRNIEFVLSDLFNSIDGMCDLLLANPPYLPDGGAQAGDNFWSGGIEGTNLLRRIVHELPSRLERGGTAHIIALYPLTAGTSLESHLKSCWTAHSSTTKCPITRGRCRTTRTCFQRSPSKGTNPRGVSGW